jgi:hypothetical protein
VRPWDGGAVEGLSALYGARMMLGGSARRAKAEDGENDGYDPMTEQKRGGAQGHRTKRRLSDTILLAFHHACDQMDVEVAQDLLNIIKFIATRPSKLPCGFCQRLRQQVQPDRNIGSVTRPSGC